MEVPGDQRALLRAKLAILSMAKNGGLSTIVAVFAITQPRPTAPRPQDFGRALWDAITDPSFIDSLTANGILREHIEAAFADSAEEKLVAMYETILLLFQVLLRLEDDVRCIETLLLIAQLFSSYFRALTNNKELPIAFATLMTGTMIISPRTRAST